MKKILKFLITALMLLSLTSCGVPESQKALDTYLKKIVTREMVNEKTDPQAELTKEILKKFEYKILKTNEKGDVSEIETKLKYPDLAAVSERYMSKILPLAFSGISTKELDSVSNEYFQEILNSQDLPYIEEKVVFYLIKKDNEWKIDPNKQVKNNFLNTFN